MSNYIYIGGNLGVAKHWLRPLVDMGWIVVLAEWGKINLPDYIPSTVKVIKMRREFKRSKLDFDFILEASTTLNQEDAHREYITCIESFVRETIKPNDQVLVWGSGEFSARTFFLKSLEMGAKTNFVESFFFRDTIQISHLPFMKTKKYGLPELDLLLASNNQSYTIEDQVFLNNFRNLCLSKYPQQDFKEIEHRICSFVVGQVPHDVNILLVNKNQSGVRNTDDLCLKVYRINKKNNILYKPHPCIPNYRPPDFFKRIKNLTITHNSIHDIFSRSFEVHTISSTVGIEAKLHHKKVIWYSDTSYADYKLDTEEDILTFISVCRRYMSSIRDVALHPKIN